MGESDGRVPVTVSKGGPGGSVPVEAT